MAKATRGAEFSSKTWFEPQGRADDATSGKILLETPQEDSGGMGARLAVHSPSGLISQLSPRRRLLRSKLMVFP